MDNKRYYGADVELVFSDAPTGEELEQFEGWAERLQRVSGPHKFIFVYMSPSGNRQLQKLMEYSGPLTEGEFRRYNLGRGPKRERISRGKGQRKANRRDRWR